MKILLVEDDEIIAQTLGEILRDRHYIVDLVGEGDLGWEMIKTYDYDLIVLDIELPKLNGIELCQKLRSVGNQTPVLLLTAQNSDDQKVIGLDAGADDYVVKPFEITELLARIRVLLRRRNSLGSQILRWKKLSLNSSTHQVVYDQQVLNLTPKEYRLLELFLRTGVQEVRSQTSSSHNSVDNSEVYPASNQVLTRDIILDRLWDVEEAPNENTVTAHIKDLRRKLKQAGADPNIIETVYGVGYRLKPINSFKPTNKPTTSRLRKKPLDNKTLETEKVRQKTRAALKNVWHQYEETYRERLAILEKANHVWKTGILKGQLLKQAQWAAHKLAGSLGIYGFTRGSQLALEMEQLLKIQVEVDHSKRFSQLLKALKSTLNLGFKLPLNPVNRNRPVILAVDNQPGLAQQLLVEINATSMNFKRVSTPKELQEALQANLDGAILEFSLAECSTKMLNRLAQIINIKIPLPVILFRDHHNQGNRQKIARLGSHILLQQGTLDQKAIKEIIKTLYKSQTKVAKVLAVDDDPQTLAAIANLLDPLTINLTILDNPLNFWQTIEGLKPDLLILDVKMPHLSGIELCQLLRNDLRWRELPILFFTVHNDLDTVYKILTAGANDCISKTLAPTELVPKIFNYLNRGQLLTSLVS